MDSYRAPSLSSVSPLSNIANTSIDSSPDMPKAPPSTPRKPHPPHQWPISLDHDSENLPPRTSSLRPSGLVPRRRVFTPTDLNTLGLDIPQYNDECLSPRNLVFKPSKPAKPTFDPRDKRECFTRYIFPLVPFSTVDLNGRDVHRAQEGLRSRLHPSGRGGAPPRLRIQFHAGLSRLLYNTVERVRPKPDFHPPLSVEESAFKQWYDLSVSEWRETWCLAYKSSLTTTKDTVTAAHEGYTYLAEPINEFVSDKTNFVRDRHPGDVAWIWPSSRDASGRTDWIMYASDRPRAFLKWKGGSDASYDDIVRCATGLKSPLDVSQGFSIWYEGGIVNDANLDQDAINTCLLVSLNTSLCSRRHGPTRTTTAPGGQ